MIGEDREQVENADMPWRHRVWFRFWRGWRKAIIGLVVLVAVAWWTRPERGDHGRAGWMWRDWEPWLGEEVFLSEDGHARLVRVDTPIGPFDDFVDALVFTGIRSDRDGSLVTLGAFGYVWVLD